MNDGLQRIFVDSFYQVRKSISVPSLLRIVTMNMEREEKCGEFGARRESDTLSQEEEGEGKASL